MDVILIWSYGSIVFDVFNDGGHPCTFYIPINYPKCGNQYGVAGVSRVSCMKEWMIPEVLVLARWWGESVWSLTSCASIFDAIEVNPLPRDPPRFRGIALLCFPCCWMSHQWRLSILCMVRPWNEWDVIGSWRRYVPLYTQENLR